MAHHHCHGGCDHSHDELGDPALVYSLYDKIDIQKLQCFNEHEEGAGRKVFRAWDERLDTTQVHHYHFTVYCHKKLILLHLGVVYIAVC